MAHMRSSWLLQVLFFPLQCIGFLFPTNKSIWVFGAWLGKSYNDNPKYLLSYVRKHTKAIRPIWLTKNKKTLDEVLAKGIEAYLFYSLPGIYFSMISGCAIICNSWIDLPFTTYFPRKKRIIQLWHGTPFRKVNLHKASFEKKLLRVMLRAYLGREYDRVFTAAVQNKDIHTLKNRFSIETEKIIVTGQPRTDVFFQPHNYKDLVPKTSKGKIFLYLPTWRNYSFNLFDKKFGFDFNVINDFLKKTGSHLIVKVHINEFKKYHDLLHVGKHSNISLTFIEDIYPYMPSVDALLTDYSSVMFDFMLLDKPIIFLPFDFETYTENNEGFYYNYEKTTPGPKAANWHEALVLLQSIQAGEDTYKAQREKIKHDFNVYTDGNNSKRVFEEIMKIL